MKIVVWTIHVSLFALLSLFVFDRGLDRWTTWQELCWVGVASLNFKVTADMKVTLAVWKKCPNQKVLCSAPIHGLLYLTTTILVVFPWKSDHALYWIRLQESDFGTYCYELTTFPNGSLQGQNKLEKTTENGENIYFIRHLPHITLSIMLLLQIFYIHIYNHFMAIYLVAV